MKFWTLAILSSAYLSTAIAANELSPLIEKLDKKIKLANSRSIQNEGTPVKIPVPLDLAFQRESSLWNAISEAYDHLRSHDLPARHRFLYFASKANSKTYAERIQTLESWIKEENHLVLSLGMPKYFNNEWKKKVDSIKSSIAELQSPYPALVVKPTLVSGSSLDKKFLRELKNEILKTGRALDNKKPVAAPELSSSLNGLQYVLYLMALLVTFLAGLTIRKSRDKKLNDMNENTAETSTSIVPATFEVQSSSTSFYFDQGVSIEEECRKVLEQSSHLLQMAQLKVLPATRSPFKTSVDAPTEKVSEALSWLLKGTLAIANSNGGKISHLEWQCRENYGRVSLEFTLHGLECDLKGLYLNTLVEGEASAPAFFGRSEMALSEHLASVGFKAGNKKTTISLGLDTLATNLTH